MTGEQFEAQIVDVFEIRGRGILLVLNWNGKGAYTMGEPLTTKSQKQIPVIGMEHLHLHTYKMGILTTLTKEYAQKLIGETVTKAH